MFWILEIIFFIFCFQSGFLCSEIFVRFLFLQNPWNVFFIFLLPKDFFILRCYHKFSHRNIFLSICDMCKNRQSFFFSTKKVMKYFFYLSLPNFPKTQDIIFLQRIKTEKCFDLEKMDEPKMNFTASGFQTGVCFVLKKKSVTCLKQRTVF